MKWLALFGAFTCFASFTWAMECFFTRPNGKSDGERLIRTLGLIFAAAQFWLLFQAHPSGTPLEGAGIGLYLLSAATFWWAVAANRARPLAWAFQDASPQHLVRTGPYRLVRHPFYTSYLMAWCAGAAFACSIALLIAAAIMAVIYAKAAAQEDRRFAAGPLATLHAQYRNSTGAFFPKLSPFGTLHD